MIIQEVIDLGRVHQDADDHSLHLYRYNFQRQSVGKNGNTDWDPRRASEMLEEDIPIEFESGYIPVGFKCEIILPEGYSFFIETRKGQNGPEYQVWLQDRRVVGKKPRNPNDWSSNLDIIWVKVLSHLDRKISKDMLKLLDQDPFSLFCISDPITQEALQKHKDESRMSVELPSKVYRLFESGYTGLSFGARFEVTRVRAGQPAELGVQKGWVLLNVRPKRLTDTILQGKEAPLPWTGTFALPGGSKALHEQYKQNIEETSERERERLESIFELHGKLRHGPQVLKDNKKTIMELGRYFETVLESDDRNSLTLNDIEIALVHIPAVYDAFKSLQLIFPGPRQLFEHIDKNCRGEVTVLDFQEGLLALVEARPKENQVDAQQSVALIFELADRDDNGTLERSELITLMQGLDPIRWRDEALINRMVEAADCDKNGLIDYKELLSWIFEDGEDQRVSN